MDRQRSKFSPNFPNTFRSLFTRWMCEINLNDVGKTFHEAGPAHCPGERPPEFIVYKLFLHCSCNVVGPFVSLVVTTPSVGSEVVNDLSERPVVKYRSDHCSASTAATPSRVKERRGRFSVQAPLRCSLGSCIACRRCTHVLSEVVCGSARCGMPVLCFHPSLGTRGKYLQAPFFFVFCFFLMPAWLLPQWLIPDVRGGKKCAGLFYYNNERRHICFVFSSLKDSLHLCNLTAADSRE